MKILRKIACVFLVLMGLGIVAGIVTYAVFIFKLLFKISEAL